ADAVGGAQAGGGVVAGLSRAQVVAAADLLGRGAPLRDVVAGGDVVQVPAVLIDRAGAQAAGVAGQGVDPGDRGGGGAGAGGGEPAAVVLYVDGDVGGHGGDVGGGAAGALRVVLPGGLGHERRAAGAAGDVAERLVPHPLGPAPLAVGAA